MKNAILLRNSFPLRRGYGGLVGGHVEQMRGPLHSAGARQGPGGTRSLRQAHNGPWPQRSIANPGEQKSPQLQENKGQRPNSIANFSACAAHEPASDPRQGTLLSVPCATATGRLQPLRPHGLKPLTSRHVSARLPRLRSGQVQPCPDETRKLLLLLRLAASLLPCVSAFVPRDSYSQHPEIRIPAKRMKTWHIIFSNRNTFACLRHHPNEDFGERRVFARRPIRGAFSQRPYRKQT